MKKIVFGIVCAALMFVQPVFAQKKSLVVGMGSADAGKLDPHIASTTPDKGLLSWMFNGLVRVRPGRISPEFIEPDLAESWTSNPAGTEWTFKIRTGVQCHHGTANSRPTTPRIRSSEPATRRHLLIPMITRPSTRSKCSASRR